MRRLSRCAAALLLCGCGARYPVQINRGDFAVVSTRDVPISHSLVEPDFEERQCGIFGPSSVPRWSDFVEKILAANPPGNAMVDVEFWYDSSCLVLRGSIVEIE